MNVRSVGSSPFPNLRINGQVVETRVPQVRIGPTAPATDNPVERPQDPYAPQEEFYEQAHQTAVRGENARAMLAGKKPRKSSGVAGQRKGGEDDEQTPGSKRVSAIFADDDPHQRQQQAYEVAAEFEESVKERDRSFSRKAAQVEAGTTIYSANAMQGEGSVIAGETDFVMEDTVPDIVAPDLSNTALRKILGLKGSG